MEENTISDKKCYSYKISGKRYWDTCGIVHSKQQLSKIIDYQNKLINAIIIQVINLSILFSMIIIILIILLLRK